MELIHEHIWGHRRLAYEIKGNDFGVYHVWYFTGTGKTVDELQRQFGYSDNILRNQIVKTNNLDDSSSFLGKLKLPKDKSEGKNDLREITGQDQIIEPKKNQAGEEDNQEIKEDEAKTEEKIDT